MCIPEFLEKILSDKPINSWEGKMIWYWIKYWFQVNKNVCPKCGASPFAHGFKESNRRYFCVNCGFGLTGMYKTLKH